MIDGPLIVDDGTWWTASIHPDQRLVGVIDFAVKPRADGCCARSMTDLDTQEHFIFKLISRTIGQAVTQLFHPEKIQWLWDTSDEGHCTVQLLPVYKTKPSHLMDNSEIAQAIREKMALILSGQAQA